MDDAPQEGSSSAPAFEMPLTEARPLQGQAATLSSRDLLRFGRIKQMRILLKLLRKEIDVTMQLGLDAVVRHKLCPSAKGMGPDDIAGVHAYITHLLDALDRAAEQIRDNATSAKPLPLLKLPSVSRITLQVLGALAAGACDGVVVSYVFSSVNRKLPILPRSMLSDVRADPKTIAVEALIRFVGHDWDPEVALIRTASGDEYITRWPYGAICGALHTPHIVRGNASLDEESGAMLLDEGATIEPKRDRQPVLDLVINPN